MAYTREAVLKDRLCGLKYFDLATATPDTKKQIIEKIISIHKEFPDIWKGKSGWSNIQWAAMNAVMGSPAVKREVRQSWNIDEILTEDEMNYVAAKTNLKIEDYQPIWERKVLKRKPKMG